eukprot:scaffold1795_cov187-Alexandrium_tamarense.AAC.6
MSVAPGMGMLVNGVNKNPNLIPNQPTVDNGGLKRGLEPGAGAITHHYNYTWNVDRDLNAGDELFVEYGQGWFKERGFETQVVPTKWNVSHLSNVGHCLDNIVPGKSLVKGAGRGAFASRDLKEGTVVAPAPLIALSSTSLEMAKERQDGSIITSTQLLKNYCFGHPDSSLLLYPYSHGVNLINHNSKSPNVKLRWWSESISYFNTPILELQQFSTAQLMMEIVATRPIQKGEELYLDYGAEWTTAWKHHVESWSPSEEDITHVSSDVMNGDAKYDVLWTEKEQQSTPYPTDVFTSCYYEYSNYRHPNKEHSETKSFAEWKPHKGVMSARNLRPCLIVHRALEDFSTSRHLYTVRVMNRPGLGEAERIPKGHFHLVAKVPREAIIFSDKTYTSDQHLLTAFRKEIGLGELFPEQWKDLLERG